MTIENAFFVLEQQIFILFDLINYGHVISLFCFPVAQKNDQDNTSFPFPSFLDHTIRVN
jgi:hypothetical protein